MSDVIRAAGDSGAETVEQVAADGAVIGLVTRSQMRAQRLCHRAVFVAVVSSRGDLLIHQRSPHKDVWPGWWDIAVGGVVAVDESWLDAARRELSEEVGVDDVVPVPIDGGHARHYVDDVVELVGCCFVVRHDGPFRFADGEVTSVEFVAAEQLHDLLHRRDFLPDSLALLLPLLDGFGPHDG